MAKRRKKSKAQKKRGKLPKRKSAKRGKARPSVRAKVAKRAKAKPKRAVAKKSALKMKQPVAAAVEPAVVDVIEQPAPDVTTVTEVDGVEIRKAG